MTVRHPCCCVQAFSNCGEQNYSLVLVHRLLIVGTSPVAEDGLRA